MKALLLVTIVLSVASLFIEQSGELSPFMRAFVSAMDYIVILLILIEVVTEFRRAAYKRVYIKRNLISLGFNIVFIVLFT